MALKFNIIDKNYILGFIQLIRGARPVICTIFYCNWQYDQKKNKKKKQQQREWEEEWESFSGMERDFPPVLSGDWDGRKRLKLWCILETGDEPLV